MITSLTTWLRMKLDEHVPTDEILANADIEQILLNHRVRDPDRAELLLNPEDTGTDIDSETGMVELRLRDLRGTKQYYGHDYIYYFHPDGFGLTVNDVAVGAGLYTFSPISVDVMFTAPRTEASPDVRIQGHLLNWRAAMMEAGNTIILKLARQPSIKRNEFEWLVRRFRKELNSQYKPKRVRRR